MTAPLFNTSNDCRTLMDLDPVLQDLQQQRKPNIRPIVALPPKKLLQPIGTCTVMVLFIVVGVLASTQ